MTDITLSPDQKAALLAFNQFLVRPEEQVFVLSGYSGTGKSTLISYLLQQLPAFMKTWKLLNPNRNEYQVQLTATTNKAAETLQHISGLSVATIHSFLGLRVNTDYKTGETTLTPKSQEVQTNYILFIDEASYIDGPLLDYIFKLTADCKIVFMGDPAQLTPVKCTTTPVFSAGFTGAHLTQVMRQAEGNPITTLATQFRHTVNTGEWKPFKPDGHHVVHLPRPEFNKIMLADFSRPDWKYRDSKFLAWTNKRVIEYNQHIREKVKGDPHFQEGDYAVCNSFVTSGKASLKTDQLVHITRISEDTERFEVPGNYFLLDDKIELFMPKSLAARNLREKQAKALEERHVQREIDSSWIDLRAAYAQTINKAQGSTYDSVFIDLDDIRRCNSGNQIARMMYVGVSRARQHVYMTGDLV